MTNSEDSLADCLEHSLQQGVTLSYYHISTAPELCEPLFAPPPGQKAVTTSYECQLFLISSGSNHKLEPERALFAIELYIYTTSSLTTIFVSKADSTGYMKSLGLPHGSSSVIRTITTTFLSWVVRSRDRVDRKLVISLFARAQGAYLFPGSDDNDHKHILSDRGLIKWWCKVLDPIVNAYEPFDTGSSEPSLVHLTSSSIRSKAYVKVPGLSTHETVGLLPTASSHIQDCNRRWQPCHPLYHITNYPKAAARSIIPRFPDDPKSRFMDDLDMEMTHSNGSGQFATDGSSKERAGQWKSVRTLQQFWDLMAFRQECSSGRLVGFIWVLFSPQSCNIDLDQSTQCENYLPTRPKKRKQYTVSSTNRRMRMLSRKTGIIRARPLRLKRKIGEERGTRRHDRDNIDPCNQGSLVLANKDYKRVHQILLRLDFANLTVAVQSTKKFIDETSLLAGANGRNWARSISGRQPVECGTNHRQNEADFTLEREINILVPSKKRKRSIEE